MSTWSSLNRNQLVSRDALANAVSTSVFSLQSGQSIPAGGRMVNVTEANTWLVYDNSQMPTNGRMPYKRNFLPSDRPPCSDNRVLVFEICNSNSAKDDNFDIYLNDVLIGRVDLSVDAQVGSVFIGSNSTPTITESDFVCEVSDMVYYYFDPSIAIGGTNVVNMVNTKNNGSGNFGTIGVRNYLLSSGELTDPCLVADLEYSGSSGSSFELEFDYDECCPSGDPVNLSGSIMNFSSIGRSFDLRFNSNLAISTSYDINVTVKVTQGGIDYPQYTGNVGMGSANTQASPDIHVTFYNESVEGPVTRVIIEYNYINPNPAGGSAIQYDQPQIITI